VKKKEKISFGEHSEKIERGERGGEHPRSFQFFNPRGEPSEKIASNFVIPARAVVRIFSPKFWPTCPQLFVSSS
jgi:hypothetical protein